MAKRFVAIMVRGRKHRLYAQDIDIVYKKPIKKLPPIPGFVKTCGMHYADDTQEECGPLN